MDERDDEQRAARREPALGQLPGLNDSPTGASFREGPRREPRSWRAMLLTGVPPLLLAVVVLVVATR